MDINSIISATTAIGAGVGGFVGGRLTGRQAFTEIASDTVDMLQTQVNILQQDKNQKELELTELRNRVTVLEGLVTQRAEVEELSIKVSLVKGTVDRIADRVGA
jgi:hypothetical protein